MQREGINNALGLVFVLNNKGDAWNGKTVKTKWSPSQD
jgi:hypothetical protein